MASITTLRAQLKALLDPIAGLNVYSEWPGNVFFPAAIIVPIEADHEQTLGATDLTRYEIEILFIANLAGGMESAQQQLADYVSGTGASSIRTAISADRTLGGTAHGVFWRGWTRPDIEPANGLDHLGQRLLLEVWAS